MSHRAALTRERTTPDPLQPRPGPDDLRPGSMCGEYVIERELGRGGFACVYAGRHRVLGRIMAIKVLDRELAASPRALQRFIWEARTASRVRHPNVVEVVDFGRLFDGRPFLVMEYLDGESLEDRLRARGRLALAAVADLVDALAGALAAVHAAGIVHRDVKPSNVFLARADGAVKLLDFGIAKLVRPDPADRPIVTTISTRLGTPIAATPEMIRGEKVDARTDVYGLGVTLYRMLTGAWPFEGDDAELQRQHLEVLAPAPSSIAALPPAIDTVVARALAKHRDARFPGVLALAAALREALGATGATWPLAPAETGAVACHLELRPSVPTATTADRAATILDAAGEVLADQGWAITAQKSDALLAAAPAPPRTLADARALAADLTATTRPMTGGELAVEISVHADRALSDPRTGRVVGGRITNPRRWPGRRSP